MTATGALATRPGMHFSDKIRNLSLDLGDRATADTTLNRIAQLPFVDSIIALPDFHQKEDMEAPSSIAITTRKMIVPEFTSVAVNDGMGVVVTNLRSADMTPERLLAFFTRVNSHSSANFFDKNRYSLSSAELRAAILRGAPAVLGKYGFDSSVLGRLESDGFASELREGVGPGMDIVPRQLLMTGFSRSEMGLNFGGNHFLEVQAVDKVFDSAVARSWGLEPDQVVVMYHLGPGPFSGTLLHHLSRRSKLQRSRVPLFFLSKLLYHFAQRLRHGDAAQKWSAHFRRNGWSILPEASEEGILFRRALAMAMNFGFAYRMATIRAIMDGLHEAIGAPTDASLLCDVSHNGISQEVVDGDDAWVARHNACRLVSGKPTIVAGSYDVPSYLGIGLSGMNGRYHSYDHGAGSLIEEQRRSGRLAIAPGAMVRHVMTRGRRARLVAREEFPMRSSAPIDRLMSCLQDADVMRPVIRLRPLGNLKN